MTGTEHSDTPGMWDELDPSKNPAASAILGKVLENCHESAKRCARAYYIFLLIAAAQWFLISGEVKQIVIFSQTLDKIETLVWIFPLAMSVTFYQGFGLFVMSTHCSALIDELVRRRMPKSFAQHIEQLLQPPALHSFERLSSKIWKGGQIVSMFAGIAFVLLLVVLPSIAIIAALYGASLRTTLLDLSALQIVFALVTLGLLVRTVVGIVMFLLADAAWKRYKNTN